MKRIVHLLAMALVIGALAACSHKDANAPLSYVPADTPFLMANLKPMDADTRATLLKQANEQMQMQMTQVRHLATKLEGDDPRVAAVLRTYAAEFDGRTVQQAMTHMGLDINGHYAFFGLGMSPVIRMQLSDPKAFDAFVGRLEKAWGTPLKTATVDGTTYRQTVFGDKARLRFIVAIEGRQSVMALLPAGADASLLRSALGLDKPKDSVQSTDKLAKLVKARGYSPYFAAYIDMTRLPPLIAGEKDPMVKALMGVAPQAAAMVPASCEADFSRMAARMPMISMGMTDVSETHMGYRVGIDFAADITKAFDDINVKLPGLGNDTGAPLDLAIALPVKEVRGFWMAQADAVQAKPFTCPALTELNAGFGKMRLNLIKTAMPPINDLRGIRVALQSLELPSEGGTVTKPLVAGQVLVASDNPAGMLSMAQMAVTPLRDLKIDDDGKPVALPDSLTRMAGGQPAWVAMNDHLLGVAIGAGQDKALAASMKQSAKAPGMLLSAHVNGVFYRKWITAMTDAMAKSTDNMAKNENDPNAKDLAADLQQNIKMIKQQAEHIDDVSEHMHMDKQGLVIDADITRH